MTKTHGDDKLVKNSIAVGSIICVDRTIRPTYPDFTSEVIHPTMEQYGPLEYGIAALGTWFHPEQQHHRGVVSGEEIYRSLKERRLLFDCLSLRDNEEIQKKGVVFFTQHFPDQVLVAWRSIIRGGKGNQLLVPYAIKLGDEVKILWRPLVEPWSPAAPVRYFKRK